MTIPTAFIPNIYYLSLVTQHKVDGIYVGEIYQKQTFRNRVEVFTSNGREHFTIPVQKIGYPSPQTSEVSISEHGNWRNKLLQLLKSSYQGTPYWVHYQEAIERLIYCKEPDLVAYNQQWLSMLCDLFGIDSPPLVYTDNDFHPEAIDPTYIDTLSKPKRYWQVFESRFGFQPWLSSIDLLLNLGPESKVYLKGIQL